MIVAERVTSAPSPGGRLRYAVLDGLTLVRRELWYLRSAPVQLALPLVFIAALVLLFGYIFGSSIAVPGGGNFREYLMPGLFVMASVTPLMMNALSIAQEKAKGVMDRFRSMPMSRLAVPLGWTGADLIVGMIGLVSAALVGLFVGWRPHEGVARTVGAFLLLMLFRYAMSWLGVFLGLAVKRETLDSAGPLFFPFVMVSNAFTPTDRMPTWLRVVAEWNPVSAAAQAARHLFGNPYAEPSASAWPLHHPVLATVLWSILLILVFGALSANQYVRGED